MRKWDGYDSPLPAEEILFLLDLQSGIRIDVTVKDRNIVSAPARLLFSLEQLLKEQKELERKSSRRIDEAWLNGCKRGRELL